MSVILYTKEDLGIKHITSVFINTRTGLQKYFIYSIVINGCTTHFNVLEDTKYIGYYNDKTKKCIVINIIDEDFAKITFEIEEIQNILKTHPSPNTNLIFGIINATDNFEYFYNFPHCVETIVLDSAKEQIAILNSKFKCLNYRISIDYIFQLKENTEIQILDDQIHPLLANTLLLSVFKGNRCISSIEVILKKNKGTIVIESNTHKEYYQRKFNKLLRSVIIIIATSLYPTIKYVYSVAVNPISSYLMVKHFNAKAYIVTENIERDITTSLTKYTDHIKHFQDYEYILIYVKINDKNIANAERMFDITEKEIKCKRRTMRAVMYMSGDENDNGKSLSGSPIKSRSKTLKKSTSNSK
jgi:hypothetical protein